METSSAHSKEWVHICRLHIILYKDCTEKLGSIISEVIIIAYHMIQDHVNEKQWMEVLRQLNELGLKPQVIRESG